MLNRLTSKRAVVVVTLLLVSSVASAQRGGSGGSSRSGFGRTEKPDWEQLGRGSGGLQLSNRDVEDMNPLKLLIDKKKDLKLTDDQVKQFKDLESKLKISVEPSFKALDSLRREMRMTGTPTDQERARMMSARPEVLNVVAAIRASYTAAFKETEPLLDEGQQKTAADLLQKHNEESEEKLRQKLGGRGGGRG